MHGTPYEPSAATHTHTHSRPRHGSHTQEPLRLHFVRRFPQRVRGHELVVERAELGVCVALRAEAVEAGFESVAAVELGKSQRGGIMDEGTVHRRDICEETC